MTPDERTILELDRAAHESSPTDPEGTLAGRASALIRRLIRDLADAKAAELYAAAETILDRDARAAMQTILQTEWPAIDKAAASDSCNTDAQAVSLALAIHAAWQIAELMQTERARRKKDAKP